MIKMWTLFGRWIDHPCRTPSAKWSAGGDRWRCRCGQVWQVEDCTWVRREYES